MTVEKEVYTISIGQMTKLIEKAKRLGYDDSHFMQILPVDAKTDFPKIRITNHAFSHGSYIEETLQTTLLTFTY